MDSEGNEDTITADAVVNAAGLWSMEVLTLQQPSHHSSIVTSLVQVSDMVQGYGAGKPNAHPVRTHLR